MAETYYPNDYLYLSARLHARESAIVGKERLARLSALNTREEVVAALVAEGVFEEGVPREDALEALLREEFDLVKECAKDPVLFAFLQYPYDCHNLKTALKCHFAGKDAASLLIALGTVDVKEYENFPVEMPKALPTHMKKAVVEARETYTKTGDPREIDFILDAACFADMCESAAALPFAAKLVCAQAEMTNLRTCRRVLAMQCGGAGEQLLSHAFVPGGVTGREALLEAYRGGEEGFESLIARSEYAEIFESGDPAQIDRAADDLYLRLAREGARVAFGPEVVIGHLIGLCYAVKNLRILLVAKETGADADTLARRLRESYV